ncbi:MAG: hypothetical protein IPJ78_16795 [Gemmatimonadetes bacterium]|nr:hypothetical protein [Gemmatimonadota bacterium]
MGVAGGLNLYGYAGGDPINFADPVGLTPCTKDEVDAGRETVANKGGFICVERRNRQAQETLAQCAADQIGVKDLVLLGAIPLEKKALGLTNMAGASPFTNVIGCSGHVLFPNASSRASRCSARVAPSESSGELPLAAPVLLLYDAAKIATC